MSSNIASAGPRLDGYEVAIDGTVVRAIKLQNDPLCLRVSLGGTRENGYYLTYRGDEEAVEHLLSCAFAAFARREK